MVTWLTSFCLSVCRLKRVHKTRFSQKLISLLMSPRNLPCWPIGAILLLETAVVTQLGAQMCKIYETDHRHGKTSSVQTSIKFVRRNADTMRSTRFAVQVTLTFDLLTSKLFCQLLLTWVTSLMLLNVVYGFPFSSEQWTWDRRTDTWTWCITLRREGRVTDGRLLIIDFGIVETT